MNRARRPGESFSEYRAALVVEAESLKQWQKGVPIPQGMTPQEAMSYLYSENGKLRAAVKSLTSVLDKVQRETTDEDTSTFITEILAHVRTKTPAAI